MRVRRAARRPAPGRPTACSPSGRPTPRATGAADVVNEIVRVGADGAPRCWSPAPTSSPTPGWRRTASRCRGCSGTTRTCRGTPPSWSSAPPTAPSTCSPAAPGSPSSSRSGASDLALWFFSDRTDFWSLYRKRPHEEPELVVDVGGDIAGPQWVFGQSRFALLADGRVAFAYGRDGADRLAVLEADGEHPRARRARSASSGACRPRGRAVVCVAAGPASEPVVLRVDVDGGEPEILRPARDLGLDPAWFSQPGARDLPDRGPRHRHRRRARAGLPADQPGGDRARGRPAAADGDRARRPDRRTPSRCSTSRCSTGRRAGSASPTSTTAARPATAAATGTRCRAAGASSTSTTSSPVPASSPTAAGWTRPAWRSAGGSAGGYTTLAALTHAARRLHRRGQPLRRRRPRRPRRRDAQVRVALPRRARRAVARRAGGLRRALADQPRGRPRHPARGVPGRRGRGRAAGPGGGRSSPRCGRRACRTPTCCSPGSSTASARRRTSARRWTASCRSTPQVWGFELPADEGIAPIDVIRAVSVDAERRRLHLEDGRDDHRAAAVGVATPTCRSSGG